MSRYTLFWMLTCFIPFFFGCDSPAGNDTEEEPLSEATQLPLELPGSLQNPAWSPDGNAILFTRFENGYNQEPADLYIADLESNSPRLLVSDGSGNINLPGAAWNANIHRIVFASTRDPHDEIYLIEESGAPGDEWRLTHRDSLVAYEPSFSPDGEWVAFESHVLDVEGNGVIVKYRVDGTGDYIALTPVSDDCRQPNWSPSGDRIVYQRVESGRWDLWVMEPDGSNPIRITSGTGDKTDASFSPDGEWLVYSSDEGDLEFATLFIVSVSGGSSARIPGISGYAGAPSWSPDGSLLAFEGAPGDPDGSEGTTLWLVDVPAIE